MNPFQYQKNINIKFLIFNIKLNIDISLLPVKSVQIRSFSGPCFPVFGLNIKIYGVNLRIQSEWRKKRTRKTPYFDTFYPVSLLAICVNHFTKHGRWDKFR